LDFDSASSAAFVATSFAAIRSWSSGFVSRAVFAAASFSFALFTSAAASSAALAGPATASDAALALAVEPVAV